MGGESTNHKSHKHSENTGDDDLKIDVKQIKQKFSQASSYIGSLFSDKKKSNFLSIIGVVLLLIILSSVAIWYRMGPFHLDVTEEWAYNTAQQSVRADIVNQLRQDYPTLPEAELQNRADQQLTQFFSDPQIKQSLQPQIDVASQYFKSRLQDEHNQTYLLSIDPWYFYRLTKNYIENGHPGEFLDDQGKPASSFQNAPTTKGVTMEFIIWFQATMYKFLKPFLGLSIENIPSVIYFTQIIFMVLAVITAFFLGKKLSGNLAGFITAALIAVHPVILNRTMGGYVHKDSFNIFFPLLITYLVISSWQTKSLAKSITYSIFAGAVLLIYQWAWVGYLFIFYILLGMIGASLIAHIIVHIVREGKTTPKKLFTSAKTQIIAGALFIVSSIVVLAVSKGGILSVIRIITESIPQFARIKDTTSSSLWPNIYTTVAELNPASLSQIIGSVGGGATIGKLLFLISVGGFVLYTIYNLRYKNKQNMKYDFSVAMLALFWFGSTIYASLKGVRFMMLLTPIFCLGIGLFAGTTTKWLSELAAKSKEFNPRLVTVVLSVLFVALFIQIPAVPATGLLTQSIWDGAYSSNRAQVPMVTDEWYAMLKNIEQNSSQDAIISSWWDFGHQFISIANRGATADGGSQNTPQSYWLGRMLVEQNETKAIGVLRMLNCDSNGAYEKIDAAFGEKKIALEKLLLVEDLIGVSKQTARLRLEQEFLTSEQVDDILLSTHCQPPESFVIASEDMVGKAGVWGHFGLWNFTKAYHWNVARSQSNTQAISLLTQAGLTEAQARQEYAKLRGITEEQGAVYIAEYPQYITPRPLACQTATVVNSTETVRCPIRIRIANDGVADYVIEEIHIENPFDEQQVNATLMVGRYQNGVRNALSTARPVSLIVVQNTTVSEKSYADGQSFSVTYDIQSNSVVLSSQSLARSVFTRLFFFDGEGTNYFSSFDQTVTVFGQKVNVFTVNWSEYLQDYS